MRHVFTLIVVLVGGMAGLLCSWHSAAALPAAAVSAPVLAAAPIEKVGYWKHYCKFNDCSGNAVATRMSILTWMWRRLLSIRPSSPSCPFVR